MASSAEVAATDQGARCLPQCGPAGAGPPPTAPPRGCPLPETLGSSPWSMLLWTVVWPVAGVCCHGAGGPPSETAKSASGKWKQQGHRHGGQM